MIKKLRYFCTLLLMAVVSVAWADKITFADLGLENGTQYSDPFDGGSFTVTFAGGANDGKYYNTGSGIRVYGGGTMTITAKSGNITGITITYDGSNKPTSADVVNVGTYTVNTGVWTGTAESVVFTRPTGNGHWRVKSIEVTVESASGDTPSITASNVNIAYNDTAGEIVYTIENEVEGGSVSATKTADWLTLGENFESPIAFTCEANEGGERTATVTLTYSYGENESVTKNVTVTQAGNPNRPGTENNPYTVAQAREAIDNNTDITGVYAMGIVSDIVTPLDTQYGNITYNISIDGSTTADQLQAFRGKSYNGENFTSADDIKVGDEVVVFGNLKKYNSIYEFDANNQLVSLNRPTPTEPTIEVGQKAVNVGVEGDTGILTVQYLNIDDVVADIQFYDAAGVEVDANEYEDWFTALLDENNNVNYIALENNGEERTAYFKVFALGGEDYVYSDLITITQDGVKGEEEWVLTSLEDLTADDVFVIVGSNGSDFAMTNDKGTSNPPAVVAVTVEGDKIASIVNDNMMWNVSGNATDGYTFFVNGDSEKWLYCTATNNGVRVGTNTNKTFTISEEGYLFNSATSRYVGIYNSADWRCYTSINNNIKDQTFAFYKKVETYPALTVKLTIRDGFTATTFSCDKALDFSAVEGITAFIITDEKGATTQVTKVPAGEGLYIERGDTEGTIEYEVPILADATDAEDMTGNLLVGTISEPVNTKTLEGNYTYYLFGKQNGKEAFFKVGEGTSEAKATASAGKAYLAVAGANNAKEMIVIGGDVTGIESIENGIIVNDNYYTIDGKFVKGQPTQKGLYIVNGRKVVVK